MALVQEDYHEDRYLTFCPNELNFFLRERHIRNLKQIVKESEYYFQTEAVKLI